MTEISFSGSGALAGAYPRAGGAADLAEIAREARSGQALSVASQGVAIANDYLGVARSAHFAAEAEAAASAGEHAGYAAALLDSADDALADIADRLEDLATLAEEATDGGLSDSDRSRLDTTFQTLKAEIEDLAAHASFGDASVLAGDGSGGPLRMEIRVGTGSAASDRIEIEIGSAAVAELSAALDSGDLRSADAATDAQTAVADAQDALDAIRARIAGDRARVGTAWLAMQDREAGNERARGLLSDPSAAIDLARIVADQVAEESDIALAAGADQHLRRLLTQLDSLTAADARSAETDRGEGIADRRDELQPITVEPAASRPDET